MIQTTIFIVIGIEISTQQAEPQYKKQANLFCSTPNLSYLCNINATTQIESHEQRKQCIDTSSHEIWHTTWHIVDCDICNLHKSPHDTRNIINISHTVNHITNLCRIFRYKIQKKRVRQPIEFHQLMGTDDNHTHVCSGTIGNSMLHIFSIHGQWRCPVGIQGTNRHLPNNGNRRRDEKSLYRHIQHFSKFKCKRHLHTILIKQHICINILSTIDSIGSL